MNRAKKVTRPKGGYIIGGGKMADTEWQPKWREYTKMAVFDRI